MSVKTQVLWVPRAEVLGCKYSLLGVCPQKPGRGQGQGMHPLILEGIKGWVPLIKAGYPVWLLLVQGVDGKTLWQEAPAPRIPPVALSSPPLTPSSWVCAIRQVSQDKFARTMVTLASHPHWPGALIHFNSSLLPHHTRPSVPPDCGPGQLLVFLLLPCLSLKVS